MWTSKWDIVYFFVLGTFAITTLAYGGAEEITPRAECNMSMIISGCGTKERCIHNTTTGRFVCVCRNDYIKDVVSNKCVERPTTLPPLSVPTSPETTTKKFDETSGSSGSSVAVGLLVPTFLIVLGVLGFYAARRYRLFPCRRNLYGNVLVTRDDDDDDPPIA